MGFARFLVLLAFVGFLIHWWNGRDRLHPGSNASSVEASASGFLPAAMPDGAPPNTVVIFAPLNCPSEEAQRAESLAHQLKASGIPVLRSSQFSASQVNATSEDKVSLDRALQVLKGEVPAVFVNGMAKANPSPDEVIAEYQRTR